MRTPSFLLALLSAGAALAAQSKGCGNTTLPAGLTPGGRSVVYSGFASGGHSRSYRLYLPGSYDAHTASPLMLSFHGSGGSSQKQEEITQFSDGSVNTEYVVAYPNGMETNAGNRVWQGANYSVAGVDDVRFANDLLDFLEDSLCVDIDRVYASGKSNGGGFCSLLSCDEASSRRFAAFAAVSGAFYAETHQPCTQGKDKVPFMEFHGLADETIPYTGGEGTGGDLPTIPDWLAEKTQLNGCNASPDELTPLKDGRVTREKWFCGETEAKPVIWHYREQDMAHKWPGTEQTGDTLVTASPRILEFFGIWT